MSDYCINAVIALSATVCGSGSGSGSVSGSVYIVHHLSYFLIILFVAFAIFQCRWLFETRRN